MNHDPQPELDDGSEPTVSQSEAYAYPLLLKQLLKTAIARGTNNEIVYRDVARFDYRTLSDRIHRLADGLTKLGFGAGDTIGILDWDSHRYLENYFAIPGMGAVLHMVNVRLSPEQILYTINHARDDALLVHVDFLPLIESIWDRVIGVRAVIVLTDGAPVPETSLPISTEYEELLSGANTDFVFPDFDENTRATTFYTTGTTGLPKGVFFSHRQLVLHTLALATTLASSPAQGRIHRDDVYMPITPMFHVHAWGFPFIATMLGLKQVYPGRYDPDTLLRLQQDEGVTLSHCVPTILQMVLSSQRATTSDLSRWKIIIGGAALTKGLAYAALDLGIDVFTGYGMSETCPILTIAQLTAEQLAGDTVLEVDARARAGSPILLVDIKIAAAEGAMAARTGQTGEIVVRAPWLTQGYVGDVASTEALWAGGHLHTGDIGTLRPDGSLQITDRLKDVIKTGGEWVSSLEIEDIILQHAGIVEAAVIGVPDAKWSERPLAVVVVSPDHADIVTDQVIRAHLQKFNERGQISKWAIPAEILFVDSLPKTSVGKLDKKLLRARHGHA